MTLELHQRTALPRHKNLVFTSAGDKSNLSLWLKGRRNFDLWVCYYGEQEGRHKESSDYYMARKGGKFPNFHFAYQRWRHLIDQYEAILIMDDDIIISGSDISRLFDIRRHYDLWVIQPAFLPEGKICHAITRQRPCTFMRSVNFVEVTCPLFRKDKLDEFMRVYDPVLVGWGIDLWMTSLFAPDVEGRMAVIDAVPCINPRDETKGGIREIDMLQDHETRKATWEKARIKYGLPSLDSLQYREFGAIKSSFKKFPYLTFRVCLRALLEQVTRASRP